MTLSIITINYNNKEGLLKTIDSVMSQTWREFEWIIIDGGSTDGSKDVIENLAANPDANISYWCSEPDRGIYNAMNKGIVKANGEYINFMNSGDYYINNHVLFKVSNHLDSTCIIYGNTKTTDEHYINSKYQTASLKFMLQGSYCHQSMFIKTSLQKKYMYDEKLKICSDWKFFLITLIVESVSFKCIDIDIALYDVTGISSKNEELYSRERKQIIKEFSTRYRYVNDYLELLTGVTSEDKLYIEIKHSKLHKIMYSLNVISLRMFTLFVKGSTWAKKYPICINESTTKSQSGFKS